LLSSDDFQEKKCSRSKGKGNKEKGMQDEVKEEGEKEIHLTSQNWSSYKENRKLNISYYFL
jgi:tRNA A37 methylthiotransferase MiaB